MDIDYRQRRSWTRQKDGSYKTSDRRFMSYKAYNRVYGGDCWKVRDRVTEDVEYGRTFTECRNSAATMAYMTAQGRPDEYRVGMTAYMYDGSVVKIDAIGHDEGYDDYDCQFTWISGKNKGEPGYIGNVCLLYIRKKPGPGNMELL